MKPNSVAIVVAILIFVAGLALVAAFHYYEVEDTGTKLITLLLIPFVAYGVTSGKLLELSAPGGFSAKFQTAARAPVAGSATQLTDKMKPLQQVEKRSNTEIRDIVAKLEKGKPVALTVRFGKANYYKASVSRNYIKALLSYDPDLVIVIVDNQSDEFVAMIDANAFLGLSDVDEQKMLNAIGQQDLDYLKKFPQFLFEGIADNASNAEALRKMSALNTKTLVVLNRQEQPHAIVKRDDIVANILEQLTTA